MKAHLSILALAVMTSPVITFAQAPANALLTGKTPANFTVPSGWTLVRTQDFESGSVAVGESARGSITTTSPHTGLRSLQGRVWKDDCATGWRLSEGVATTTELYLSWYEFMEGQGRMNDEMFLLSIRKDWPGGKFESQRWQWLNNLSYWEKCFNILEGNLVFFCEGTQPGTTGSVCYYNKGVWRSVGFGKWQQWEVYWKANTPGMNDGVTQIYLDGVKITEVTGTAYSGLLNMSGPAINLGGPTYTKIIWGPYKPPSTVVATNVREINYSINRPQDFSLPVLGGAIQAPPDGYVPIFHRFVDDIIILQRGTLPPPDSVPPSTPTNLTGPAIATPSTPIALSWTASTDNIAVTGYQIYRNGRPIGTSPTTSFTDTKGRTAGTTYEYTVVATDAVGNISPASAAASLYYHDETITSYTAWRTANFTGADLTNDAVSGPLADPDGCGYSNLARYAFRLPARGRVTSPISLSVSDSGTDKHLELTFRRKGYAPGLQYIVQSSNDLVTWSELQTVPPGYSSGEKTFTFTDSVGVGAEPRRFLRVRVTQQ